jgi:hypothetical protein
LNLAQAKLIRGFLLPQQIERMPPWKYGEQPPPRPWAQLAGLKEPPAQQPAKSAR